MILKKLRDMVFKVKVIDFTVSDLKINRGHLKVKAHLNITTADLSYHVIE